MAPADMFITSNAYEGVELLARLAAHSEQRPCYAQTPAQWSPEFVAQAEILLEIFCKAGLVMETHGPAAGYRLARPAEQISVADIIRALGEPRVLTGRSLREPSLKPDAIGHIDGTETLWEALRALHPHLPLRHYLGRCRFGLRSPIRRR